MDTRFSIRGRIAGSIACALLVLFVAACDNESLVGPESSSVVSGSELTDAAGKNGGAAVPGQYIVVFKPGTGGVANLSRQMASQAGGRLGFIYEHAIEGFSVSNISENAAAALAKNPNVAYVEQDRTVQISAQSVPTGIKRIFADTNAGLDIDGSDDNRVDVDVAIIDTGIDFQHPDLNVAGGVSCAGGSPLRGSCSSGGDDDHYHGTHVAGSVAALDNGVGVVGVAPGARVWAVKVLNSQGSGYTSWIVAGIDWVTANASTIEVANMSLGGSGFSQAEYDAIQRSVNAGVAYAVAAGNSDADANNYSPAAFNNVLSVSALADFDGLTGGLGSPTCRADQDDTLADFSNWGSAVDIAAPGVCILSTFPIEQGEYGTISGTSMASPHVAGALAILASKSNPGNAADVSNLYNTVTSNGNLNWTDDSGDGVKERLLDVSNTTVFSPVLVSSGSGGGGDTGGGTTGITLSASGYKVKGLQTVDLTWSGAASTSVDVVRNGSKITTTANDGAYTDSINSKGGGTYTYKVCEAGTATCSNEATVTF